MDSAHLTTRMCTGGGVYFFHGLLILRYSAIQLSLNLDPPNRLEQQSKKHLAMIGIEQTNTR